MSLSVRPVVFGRPALEALGQEAARLQRTDPLAPVTVIVPSGRVGLDARRRLAAGIAVPPASDRPRGLLNVRFLTLVALAEEVAGRQLVAAGRLPLTNSVVQVAVRGAARRLGPEFFAASSLDHPATIRSLVASYRLLRGVPEEALVRLAAQSPRARDVVRLTGLTRSALDGWYDDVDLLQGAADRLASGALPGQLGAVVCYLPMALGAPHLALLRALGRLEAVAVLVGLTGDPLADVSAHGLLDQLAGDREGEWASRSVLGPLSPTSGGTAAGSSPVQVVSAPTPEVELLAVGRQLMELVRGGTPLDRIAVLHAGSDPYPGLVRRTLSRMEVPFNGGGGPPLTATVVGRVLLGALALPDGGWSRDDLVAWLASGPILDGARQAPTVEWDRLSRLAGIVEGPDDWGTHLSAFSTAARERARTVGIDQGARLRPEEIAREAESLAVFVARMAAELAQQPTTWAGWAAWGQRLVRTLLGAPSRHAEWPADEVEALTTVQQILGRLGVLDALDTGPDSPRFRSTLGAELGAAAPQTARFGQGVFVGHVREAVGLDFDAVFVVGVSADHFPPRTAEDPLLPDRERAVAGPGVPLRRAHDGDARRDYLAVLASSQQHFLSFARGDPSERGTRRLSPWAVAALDAGSSTGPSLRWGAEPLPEHPQLRFIPSHAAGVAARGEPAAWVDRDLRTLLRWRDRHSSLTEHRLVVGDPVLRRAIEARRERGSHRFTRFDGKIDRARIPSPVSARPQSATGLELYAACPRRYLLARVLRVEERARPEAIMRLSPKDRGSLVHEVLERFFSAEVARPAPERIRPEQPWSTAARQQMAAIAGAVFSEYEAAGLTGRRLLWALDRAAILADLQTFLTEDERYRASAGATPGAAELPFGADRGLPVVVELADGRSISFRGSIDRLDRCADGTAAVIDYKTGGAWGYAELAADAVDRGRKLQLPIYGLAARQFTEASSVWATYWFVSEQAGFRRIGYVLDEPRLGRFYEVLNVIVSGVEAGVFPAHPGLLRNAEFENCRFCEFSSLCGPDRDRRWDRVKTDPELVQFVALAEPAPQ